MPVLPVLEAVVADPDRVAPGPPLGPGLWQGTVSVAIKDALPQDNSRHVAIYAAQKPRVLVVDGAARVLTKYMSQQELKDAATFFASASGKRYVEAQPLAFNEIMGVVQNWRQRLSTDVLTRARAEMKKKGVDF